MTPPRTLLPPAADQPAADQPAADQPAADQPAADQRSADQPAADHPAGDPALVDQAAGDQPAEDPAVAGPGDGPGSREAAPTLSLAGDAGPLRLVRIGPEADAGTWPEDPWASGSQRPDRRLLVIGGVVIAGLLAVASTAWLVSANQPQAGRAPGSHLSRPSQLSSGHTLPSQALSGRPVPSQPAPSQPAPVRAGTSPARPGPGGSGPPGPSQTGHSQTGPTSRGQSGSGHPGTSGSGPGHHTTGQHHAAHPGTTQTGTHGTGSSPSGTSPTGSSQPGTSHPGSGQPGTSPTGTGHSGTGPGSPGQPGTGGSGTGGSGTGQTGPGQSGTGQSGTGQSGSGQPGSGPSGTGRGRTPRTAHHRRPRAHASGPGGQTRHSGHGIVSVGRGLAGRGGVRRVTALLDRYFASVNHREYQAYARLFAQRQLTPRGFAWGYRTSHDSNAMLVGITALNGGLKATVTFTSHQDPAESPDHSSCINWRITLFLHRAGPTYLIGMPPTGYHAGLQACRFAPRHAVPPASSHRAGRHPAAQHQRSGHQRRKNR